LNNCVSSSNKQTNQAPHSYKAPIVILGPTGVGKTDLALELAHKLDGHIINADSAQMYTPLTIGTAKPNYKNSAIVHHCFDIIGEPVHYDVMQYRQKLIDTVTHVQQRNKVPIIVGGSGFYIKSLLYPPMAATMPAKMPDLEKVTWDDLHAIDPVRAAQIHPQDSYRIKRAMEIWYQQGIKPSECKPVFEPWTDMNIVWVTRDRESLYERINKRVIAMIDAGWIDEVQQLRNTPWESFLHEKKIIGYDLILSACADNGCKEKEQRAHLIEKIQQKTRNYAKAQIIFWKSFKAQIAASLKNYQGPYRITIKETSPDYAGLVDPNSSELKDPGLTLATHDLYINQLLQIYT